MNRRGFFASVAGVAVALPKAIQPETANDTRRRVESNGDDWTHESAWRKANPNWDGPYSISPRDATLLEYSGTGYWPTQLP